MNQHEEKVSSFLESLRERAIVTERSGSILGAQYLACICGMWAHTLRSGKKLMEKDGIQLYQWFLTGYGASEQASFKVK